MTNTWGKKTYNAVSALRCAFDFGYRDIPEKHNPATALRCFRITKKDRPRIDPFTIQEAEAVIAAIHRDWGEEMSFRFLIGLRPSEQIALLISDCDVSPGKLQITKARIVARDKDRTKTSEDRLVELCHRALHEAPPRTEGATEARRQYPPRGSLLQGRWLADPQPPVPLDPLAPQPHRDPERSLPGAL